MRIINIKNIDYNVQEESETIIADGSRGKKYWKALLLESNGSWFTSSESWQDLESGNGESKHVISVPYFAEPKNIGKKNETSSEMQARSEMTSSFSHKKDTSGLSNTRILPMLANGFLKREHKAKLDYKKGLFTSPKIDGNRCLYDGNDVWSRGGKDVIPEIFAHLHFNTRGYIIDGELVLPDNPKVNRTSSAIKKYHPGVSEQLEYNVFDIVDEDLPFNQRYEILTEIVAECGNPNIKLVPVYLVHSREEIMTFHKQFTSEGREGSIIRGFDSRYEINRRVDSILKLKDWITEEYRIVNIIPAGGGSAANVAKFICVDNKGDEFESMPEGTEEERHEYLVNRNNYINKFAVVKYRELSGDKNVPFHSNMLEIRETEIGGY